MKIQRLLKFKTFTHFALICFSIFICFPRHPELESWQSVNRSCCPVSSSSSTTIWCLNNNKVGNNYWGTFNAIREPSIFNPLHNLNLQYSFQSFSLRILLQTNLIRVLFSIKLSFYIRENLKLFGLKTFSFVF